MMSFTQYKKIGDVLADFPINYREDNFVQIIPYESDPYFVSRLQLILREGVVFNSEYSICESIIFPILTEIWRNYHHQLLIWSHEPLNYNANLSGVPDYMIAQRSARGKVILEPPYLIIVEAKKDNFEEGWGQCLAELVASQKLAENSNHRFFGIVSNGKVWEFGQLQGDDFTKNIKFYVLEYLTELMGAVNYLFAESVAQLTS
jgi:hypothetical protein